MSETDHIHQLEEIIAGLERRLLLADGHRADDVQWWVNHNKQTMRWLSEAMKRAQRIAVSE